MQGASSRQFIHGILGAQDPLMVNTTGAQDLFPGKYNRNINWLWRPKPLFFSYTLSYCRKRLKTVIYKMFTA